MNLIPYDAPLRPKAVKRGKKKRTMVTVKIASPDRTIEIHSVGVVEEEKQQEEERRVIGDRAAEEVAPVVAPVDLRAENVAPFVVS